MPYTHLVDGEQLSADLSNISGEIDKAMGTTKQRLFPDEFISDISKLSMGGKPPVASNIEIAKAKNGDVVSFSKTTGTVELWGWGKSPKPDGGQEWDRSSYVFIGNKYATDYIGTPDTIPLNLGIDDMGFMTGIPQINEGEYIGIRKD